MTPLQARMGDPVKGARLNAARGEVSGQMLLLTNFRSLQRRRSVFMVNFN